MTRYIDADLLMEKKIHHCETYDTFDYDYVTTDDINDTPTADVVEVVRCKDCKKANTDECPISYWDDDWGKWRISYAGDNWFCADGERRE